jgi:membrane-associated protease RseP (regulator of RpoE activity)
VSFLLAILGLALLVLIHEAGHFFAARAVGMKPRKFYVGFPPPLVKRVHNGIEYGIGAIPLGGYVKIPGMNRRVAGRPSAVQRLSPSCATSTLPAPRGSTTHLPAGDTDARAALGTAAGRRQDARVAGARHSTPAPDAYWRRATWRRLVAIGAGPA